MPKFINHNSLEPFPLEKGSVNMVATSPPYYALRNYGHPDQIGQESTVQEYVDNLRKVATNVWEVLADTGSYYLNIGDSYAPNKSLSLVPHRVAIAMTDDGWILRNTIIWHKKNPMPCSIKDRLTPTHEYVFHFVKQRKYYYDLDAIRVPHQTLKIQRQVDVEATAAKLGKKIKGYKMQKMFEDVEFIDTKAMNRRSCLLPRALM
jgi:DNA modification methylase